MSSILGIGQSALAAAQAALATTGHNIANASTPGYSRQSIVQIAAAAEKTGSGYVGAGTVVAAVRRSYDDLLTVQVRSAQSAAGASSSYLAQLTTVDNLLGDGKTGVAPSMQTFFSSLQGLSSDPLNTAVRQEVLSDAQSTVSQFNSLSSQLSASRDSVNADISSSVDQINTFAKQIGVLNETISKAVASGQTPNDLMDQRDQAVLDLSNQVKVSVVNDGQSGFNVFIGNGQPLVVGGKTYDLVTQNSATEQGRLEVAYKGSTKDFVLPETSLSGGTLGGILEYRSKTLDAAQNSLGRMALVMAQAINDQNKLGLDQTGKQGGDIFTLAQPVTTPGAANTTNASASASIVDAKALTTSNYSMKFDGSDFTVTRLSDGVATKMTTVPQTIDGVSFGMGSTAPAAGDTFLIQPTVNGAAGLSLKMSDVSGLAAAGAVATSAPVSNTGTGKIGSVTIDKSYFNSPLTSAVTITFSTDASTGQSKLSGFPDGSSVAYTAGSAITYGGMSFSISGSPASGDTFVLKANAAGAKDGSNAVGLAALQTSKIVGGTSTLTDAYSQIVSLVGNKTRELTATNAADEKILTQSVASQQSVSGVNLDEEAANLLKYQQAYQAAGKLMQTASTIFDVVLSLGS